MPQPRIMPWYARKDYQVLKEIIPNDPDIPDTYEEWLNRAANQLTEPEAHGVVCEKVVIDAQEFATWCRDSGLDANSTTIGAFAVKKAREQDERRAAATASALD